MNWRTFGGDLGDVLWAAVRLRCHNDGLAAGRGDPRPAVPAPPPSRDRLPRRRPARHRRCRARQRRARRVASGMSPAPVARHKTALTRVALSRPDGDGCWRTGCSPPDESVFDYGCGKGDDIRHLRALGYDVDGWDPTHRPSGGASTCRRRQPGLRHQRHRAPGRARRRLFVRPGNLAEGLLVVSARMTWDARDLVGRPMGDGLVTRTGTFQKFYEQIGAGPTGSSRRSVCSRTPRRPASSTSSATRRPPNASWPHGSTPTGLGSRSTRRSSTRPIKDALGAAVRRSCSDHARPPQASELPADDSPTIQRGDGQPRPSPAPDPAGHRGRLLGRRSPSNVAPSC